MAKKQSATENEEAEKKEKKAKKAPAKKAATKKAPTKKAAAKKTATKKAPTKSAAKKATTKKTTEKKSTEKKTAKKPAVKETKEEVKETFTSEHFSNDDLTLEKQVYPNCKVKYIIVPNKALWEKAEKEAIKKVAKEISIPGFRKGKAPAKMVMKKHPHGVKQETENAIANLSFTKAQALGKTPLLHGNNNVSFHIEGENEDRKMIFNFQSEPVIPNVQASEFSLNIEDPKVVDDQRVEEEIENVRSFYATWNQVQDRGAEDGDFLVLDIDDLDQEPPSRVFDGARFEFAKGKMAQWMRELVKDLKPGESVDGISKPDDDASKEDKETFKEKKVRIKVISIEERALPEINDELAKKVGAKDLETMKKNLSNLTKSKDDRELKQKYRVDIEKQMIDKVIFDVPASLLEKEANHRMEQLLQNPSFKSRWESEMTDEEKEEKKQEVKLKSTQAIRLFYLCRDIVAKNKISVSEEDMNTQFSDVLSMMYADQKALQYQSMTEEQKQMTLTQVMMQKAEDHIISQILNEKK